MFVFNNTYACLPERLYARVAPTPVAAPRLVKLNRELAQLLGADVGALETAAGTEVLAGSVVPDGAEPIALAYAGHQFGGFVAQLGDGRAILLGEVVGTDAKRRDVQLKGSGRTPFSRGGDGRAALGPVLREYVVSEAMFALGIPTTRALAAVTTGQQVHRTERLPGAVLTRVASSHLRVGTFEYFAARRDREATRVLVEYALQRHCPDGLAATCPALALLDSVVAAQANLVARWLGVGFVHGVMNTDNTSISGETIDFGPCAFLDEYHPEKRFSSIDSRGRYAFGNQPRIARWNLGRLAEALLAVIDDDEAQAVKRAGERLERFQGIFDDAYAGVLRAKLGLGRAESTDRALADDLLERMAADEVDFTLLFRSLCEAVQGTEHDQRVASMFHNAGAYHEWAERWRARIARDDARAPEQRAAAMRKANPAFIPRNHRIEEAIEAATHRDDLAPFETLVAVLARPFDDQPEHAHLLQAPAASERVAETFCGT